MSISSQNIDSSPADADKAELVENEDYYLEGDTMVFTARFHLRRGYCCGSGCRHCPYKGEATETDVR